MKTVAAFQSVEDKIQTPKYQLSSDEVLREVAEKLVSLGYEVESGKSKKQKIYRPVLYGKNGSIEKAFEVDAWDSRTCTVVEVEAGRGVVNHQFLKDFFEACVIQDAEYLVIAVCNAYKPPSFKVPSSDFETVTTFMDTLYASGRLQVPLKGVLVIGY